MRFQLLATTLAALTFLPAVQAQQVSGGLDPDRKSSTLFVSNDESQVLAGVSISYGQATWQDSYNGVLEQIKASNYTRLGKSWWTTLETVGPLEIGGTKVEAGSYYLGLATDKAGAFSLLLFDSRQVMKAGVLPGSTLLYRGEVKTAASAPMTLAKDSLKEVVVKMEIEITADKQDPSSGKLSIRWGKHELSAPVKFDLSATRGTVAPKK